VEIKCQLDATDVFISDLIACSTCFGHHYAHQQELKSIIQWLLPVVFGAVVFKLLVWCGAEGYVSGLQDACWFTKPVGILFPHINDDARPKSHKIGSKRVYIIRKRFLQDVIFQHFLQLFPHLSPKQERYWRSIF
jgi:hypothetical protein